VKVVSVVNFKGGVGKTTLTANLGAELASRGYKILLIDLDPQASLTFSFFPADYWNDQLAPSRTIKRWFDAASQGKDDVKLSELIATPDIVKSFIDLNHGRLDVLPSHLGLINVDLELAASLGGGTFAQAKENYMRVHGKLAAALKDRSFRTYDLALIDCAPNFNVLNKSALIASNWVLIPARADHLSTLGIAYLVGQLKKLIADYNNFAKIRTAGTPMIPRINPKVLGVVFGMVKFYGGKPVQAIRPFIDEVQGLGDVPVFGQMIRQDLGLFATAPRDGVPVAVKTSVPQDLAMELDKLADEFITRADLKRIEA
jgi:chromosome partitioning protein